MNWTITRLEGANIIRIELRGEYDLSANPRMLKEIGTYIRATPTFALLFDNRKFAGSQMTPNDMVVSSGLFADSNAGISARKIAIITPSDAETEKARQWERITRSHSMTNIAVFLDEDAAIQWLCEK